MYGITREFYTRIFFSIYNLLPANDKFTGMPMTHFINLYESATIPKKKIVTFAHNCADTLQMALET